MIKNFLLASEGIKFTCDVRAEGEHSYGFMQEGKFIPDCDKISSKFKLFYLNHLNYLGLLAQEQTKRKAEERDGLKKRPTISNTTSQLAERYRQRLAGVGEDEKVHVLAVLTAPTSKDQWIEQAKKELQEKEDEECTFKPKTNSNYVPDRDETRTEDSRQQQTTGDKCFDLYQLSYTKQKNAIEKTSEEVEFEKNAHELTFKPNTAKPKKKKKKAAQDHVVNNNSIQQAIDRMQKGRQERDTKKRMTERGYNGNEEKGMNFGIERKSKKKPAFESKENKKRRP